MAGGEDYGHVFEKKFHAHGERNCIRNHSLSLNKETLSIILQAQNGVQKAYNTDDSENFRAMLDSGYTLAQRWAYRGNDVMVATLSKEDDGKLRKRYILLFCDDVSKRLIGMTPVVYRGKNYVSYIEVFGCHLSRDRTVLGYVVGVLAGSDVHYMDCMTEVVFYDTLLWLPIRTFHGPTGIPPTFSFDPRYRRSRVALLGLEESPLIQIFCLNAGSILKSCSIDFYDADGETAIQLLHTDDGAALIMQVIEYLGWGHEILYRTYVMDSDSLKLCRHSEALLASSCHPDCLPLTMPLFSPGCRQMALLAKETKDDVSVKIYRLSLLPTLKVLCRQALLDPQLSQACIDMLSLSDDLKAFLSLTPAHV